MRQLRLIQSYKQKSVNQNYVNNSVCVFGVLSLAFYYHQKNKINKIIGCLIVSVNCFAIDGQLRNYPTENVISGKRYIIIYKKTLMTIVYTNGMIRQIV